MASTDSTPDDQPQSTLQRNLLGYLTFVCIPSVGTVGGMLLVNERARPIEFHCTCPVPSTRVHEILYGSTHRASLLADQIGRALVDHVAKSPESARLGVVITDEPEVTELRSSLKVPLALMRAADSEGSDKAVTTLPQAREADGSLRSEWSLEVGGYSFKNFGNESRDQDLIRTYITGVSGDWDLAEPFQRIRTAIEEAQRAAA